MGRRKLVLIFLLLSLNFYCIPDTRVSAENFTIEALDSLTLNYEESEESLVKILVENYSGKKINVEIRNAADTVIASRVNYTKNLYLSLIKEGQYTIHIINPNDEAIDVGLEKESFPLVHNSNTEGYSHKKDLYCWEFNSIEETYTAIFPIDSIDSKYYELYFITYFEDVPTNIWLSYENPLTEIDWGLYLEPIGFSGNDKVSVKVENGMNWIITDLSELGNYDVLVILYDAPTFTVVGKILVGISLTGVAIVVFIGIYYDPLKLRKRKVEGKSYDEIKSKYESTDDMKTKVKEVFEDK